MAPSTPAASPAALSAHPLRASVHDPPPGGRGRRSRSIARHGRRGGPAHLAVARCRVRMQASGLRAGADRPRPARRHGARAPRRLGPGRRRGGGAGIRRGWGWGDDAAVWRISDGRGLVQTVDFCTPVVDDPDDFGRIAAANALSDVYAMGATPLTALNIVAFPLEALGGDVLREILRGGIDVVTQAGASVVGGHSIDDPEPKYGLAVTGVVHPDRVLTNAGARAGDALVLTKPLGVGAVTTAWKRGVTTDATLLATAVATMTALNAGASECAQSAG